MARKEMVAMLLAGGEGKRLGLLTKDMAKPAVHFGGKYRIIDFTLSNCTHSRIDTVGVLTQYQPQELNQYLGIGSPWGLDRRDGGMSVLPPYVKSKGGTWYKGTANAIYQNMGFIESYDPDYVLIISGDHIYKMNYDLMLQQHKSKGADATIAVFEVDWKDTDRFGIISADEDDRIIDFQEKPKTANSNLASMGVYIFSWPILREYLIRDEAKKQSTNDFGKDLIPEMLSDGVKLNTYSFNGYWKDVGTIESLWEANMDLLSDRSRLNLNDKHWRIFSVNPNRPAQYIAPTSKITSSFITEGCFLEGVVDRSVLFYGVQAAEGSFIQESVIMPKAKIGRGVRIYRAIIGEGVVVDDDVTIGNPESKEITLIGNYARVNNLQPIAEVKQG
jgi:glucose-1-phosphate adenylyltransferase